MQNQQQQTFHRSFAKVLFITQIFGLFPLSNVLTSNVYDMYYSWLSLRTFYSAAIVLLNSLEFLTVVNLWLTVGFNFHISGKLCFFAICLLEHVYLWRLAIKWPFIMRIWRQTEEIFLRSPYRLYATLNMKWRIYALASIVMLGAFAEHCLLLYYAVHRDELHRRQWQYNESMLESLYKAERDHLIVFIPYNAWLLPILEWVNLTLTYPRSFVDVLIMCVSIGMVARFNQLHLRIFAVREKAMPGYFWVEVRQHYLALKRLMNTLNKSLAALIVLACGNNMYFICLQLYNSFQNIREDAVSLVAFWYSLLFAITRTLLTLYIASTVCDCTKKILATLRDVPSRSWCLEIQRFSEQLAVDLTALSGNGFFFITRPLILAMASTVVTYELMVRDVIA